MSIHAAIKARRTRLGMSQQALADAVSVIEGRTKMLSWQMVQQWELDTAEATAPKRKRLGAVAQALKTTLERLMAGDDSDPPMVPIVTTKELVEPVSKLMAQLIELHSVDPLRFDRLAKHVDALVTSIRQADEMLREDHHVTGYVSPERAAETLGREPPPPIPISTDISFGIGEFSGGMSGFDELREEPAHAAPAPTGKGKKK